MALIKCPECGHEVSTRAAACPHCGAPPKAAPGMPAEKPAIPQKTNSEGGVKNVSGSAPASPGPEKYGMKWALSGPLLGVLVLVAMLVFAELPQGIRQRIQDAATPERCQKCGAKVSWRYAGSGYCDTCAKEIEDLQEAVERAKYIMEHRGK